MNFMKRVVPRMLVLKRKPGESLVIGENIEIKVIEITDSSVKIGIEAPKEISITRKEIIEDTASENKASTSSRHEIESLKNIFRKK